VDGCFLRVDVFSHVLYSCSSVETQEKGDGMEIAQFIRLLKEQGIEEDLEYVPDEFYAKWGTLFLELDSALSSFIEADDLDGYNLFIELIRRIIATKLDRYKIESQMPGEDQYGDFFWRSLWNRDDQE
jgi:hypothetical protein